MTIHEQNRQALIEYFQGGCKGNDMGCVGVEMEHFILDEDGEQVHYDEPNGRLSIRGILEKLAEFWPDVTRTEAGDIMGCSRQLSAISIEPAGQIEVSLAPFSSIYDIKAEYENFYYRLRKVIEPAGYTIRTGGYNPTMKAEELELIPKPRYHFMNEYFASLPGMHGERMMRATTSLQISLDYADEADAVRKMRIATLLGPIVSFVCDNCTVFEGELNDVPLRRLQVWRKVDPARCGVVPGLFDEGFGFGTYADWLLSVPPIFSTRDGEHATGATPADEVYADAPMTEEDVFHLLGMVWPDVRLKNYVEVRQADSLPEMPALGYVSLIKGIYYGPLSLDMIEHKLGVDTKGWGQYSEQSVEDAIAAIAQDGFDALVYGRSVTEWIDFLFQLAPAGLGSEVEYLDELRDFRGL